MYLGQEKFISCKDKRGDENYLGKTHMKKYPGSEGLQVCLLILFTILEKRTKWQKGSLWSGLGGPVCVSIRALVRDADPGTTPCTPCPSLPPPSGLLPPQAPADFQLLIMQTEGGSKAIVPKKHRLRLEVVNSWFNFLFNFLKWKQSKTNLEMKKYVAVNSPSITNYNSSCI